MSAKVVRNQAASLPLWNNAPNSASAAEETTTLRIVQGTCTLPLMGGGGALGSMLVMYTGSAVLMKKKPSSAVGVGF